ncbi:hypothetical protein PENTCL1PPCAC_25301 [Pristionchus entomophagus]|uniref:BLOC-1-related complex subunit 7 n=1 Tax=Pristionchus entomophagus TaxID=358040 RepID=A0AAV5U8M3_9BILA|nr:hypothetical protein PENTCL1PPCAC_25301 [Pristionchus entomophagus]
MQWTSVESSVGRVSHRIKSVADGSVTTVISEGLELGSVQDHRRRHEVRGLLGFSRLIGSASEGVQQALEGNPELLIQKSV